MATTRLGRSIPGTGALDDEAIRVTLNAFGRGAALVPDAQIAAVATSAVRDAKNGSAFIEAAAKIIGTTVEMVDGYEEGRLTFLGAARHPESGTPVVVIDVGGGSTEVSVGRPGTQPEVTSLQAGCVRLTETTLKGDFNSGDLATARRELEAVIMALVALPEESSVTAVGGTATTLAAFDRKLATYAPGLVEGHLLSVDRIEEISEQLAALPGSERKSHPLLPPDRGEVVVAGATVLAAALRQMGQSGCVVSERGILEGLIQDKFGVMIFDNG